MEELIRITTNNYGIKVVSARELHNFLGLEKSQISRWLDSKIFKNGFFVENEDFVRLDIVVEGQKTFDFAISLDVAKRLSMMTKSKKGDDIRSYFIACETKLNETSIPKTYAEALLEAGRLALEVENKSKVIEEMKPKADFFDQVTGSETCFDMADVAKVCNLGVGRNNLFQFLRDSKILRENNTPYQHYVDCGYFRVIESKYNKPDGSVNISLKTVVYQKGIDFIIKRFVGRNLNN